MMQDEIISLLYKNRNPARAEGMAAYMKNQFAFLGISKPQRTAFARPFLAKARKEGAIDWSFVSRLWDMPEREFQYFALDYIAALGKKLQKDDIERFEGLITAKSWWDTVDGLANLTGWLCSLYPELIQSYILKWAEAENIWLVRVSIIFQLKYKDKTDIGLLARNIRKNCGTKEFFINKAIGWALREYSKTDKAWVKEFIETTPLHPLSVREGGKYIDGLAKSKVPRELK